MVKIELLAWPLPVIIESRKGFCFDNRPKNEYLRIADTDFNGVHYWGCRLNQRRYSRRSSFLRDVRS
jgi:hypothetical protein